jgi:hypothetical protein
VLLICWEQWQVEARLVFITDDMTADKVRVSVSRKSFLHSLGHEQTFGDTALKVCSWG